MTVNTNDLTNPVLQAVETWTTAQNHDLGYETQDRSSGKRYQYRLHDDGGASASTAAAGVPCGAYAGAGSANGTTAANTVTPDASQALEQPTGVYRGAPTDGQYGFVELLEKNMVTTVKVDCSDVPIQGTLLRWDTDGELDSITVDSITDEADSAIAICLESAVDLTNPAVKWL